MFLEPSSSSTDICSRCPKFCCTSLARTDPHNFVDPSDRPNVCVHCDTTGEFGCRIHEILSLKSPACAAYTCYGIGSTISDLFGLSPVDIPSETFQRVFRQRQGVARFLVQLERDIGGGDIDQFVEHWKTQIYTSDDTESDILAEFVSALNTFMQQKGIVYDMRHKTFFYQAQQQCA